MQRTLWAKSGKRGGNRSSELPVGFRHEMLSLSLLDRFELGDAIDRPLTQHLLTSHHGFGCPLSPVWEDDSPPGFSLSVFGVDAVTDDERSSWSPAWQLDSGISERFWQITRQFGWWGAAWLQTILRLADWYASANPNQGDINELTLAPSKNKITAQARDINIHQPLVLGGVDGSKPLGYLAALGVFRALTYHKEEAAHRFYWVKQDGAWRPAIEWGGKQVEADELVERLYQVLTVSPKSHPALRIPGCLADSQAHRREFFQSIAIAAELHNRSDADWLSCVASDVADPHAISQLQTSRRDNHPKAIKKIIEMTTREHLRKTLFMDWVYSDPTDGVSLHLEPREDRRHAYQWDTPSGDPTRKLHGGMIGANRLALEAWPLFQSLPAFQKDKLVTVGFRGTHFSNTRLSWPIWTTAIGLDTIGTVISMKGISKAEATKELQLHGIVQRYQSRRILFGKTPNLTAAQPVMVDGHLSNN